jgi:hypothetical protein
MDYRVIEFEQSTQTVIKVFDSAYDAVDFIVAHSYRGDQRTRRMYIVDSEGTRIFCPTDLAQIAHAA